MPEDQRYSTTSFLETERSAATEERTRHVSLLLYHVDGVKVVPLRPKVPLVVGRSHPANAIIRDLKLSRRHASFLLEDDGVSVEDLGSTNGTRLNGEQIRRTRLRIGDEVTLGSVTASIHVLSSSEEASLALDGYDRFLAHLEEEVIRARTFGRPLALLMIRPIPYQDRHLQRYLPHVREQLRSVDIVGHYGSGVLLVGLTECDPSRAMAVAQTIQGISSISGMPTLFVGVAGFPNSATSAEELVAAARVAERGASPDAPVHAISPSSKDAASAAALIVINPKMVELYEMVDRVADTKAPVLILGETGTGKELVASTIHARSRRRKDARLGTVNCGAIPATLVESTLFGHEQGAFTNADRKKKGIFEQFDGGTLFLDEIGEFPLAAQAVLLRVLETGQLTRVGGTEPITVDVRIVAATNKNPEQMCKEGSFRLDLLYRLNTITLEAPPLRERRDEIEAFVERFVEEASRASEIEMPSLETAALDALKRYNWPGNVRELRNVIERAVVITRGSVITAADLPERILGRPAEVSEVNEENEGDDEVLGQEFKEKVRNYEIKLILKALKKTEGHQSEAARLLNMPRRTLVHKMKAYGIRKKFGK